MKLRNKTILWMSPVLIGIIALLGWYIYQDKLPSPTQFDTNLYAVATATSQDSPFSYHNYTATLKDYVDNKGMVAYQKMKEHHKTLDDFLFAISRLELKTYQSWKDKERLAFWINTYNALTLKVIIDNYPIKAGFFSGLAYPDNSIRQISGVWDKIQFLVMGQKITLNQIEHGILRSQDKELVKKFGKFYQPRIHMALVCAAMSCPTLRNEPYLNDKLDGQLNDQSKRFLSNSTKFRIDRNAGKIYLSSIFKWFGKDFIKKYKPDKGFDSPGSDAEKSVLNFISQYIQSQQAQYLQTGKYKIKYLDYDWTLNEQEKNKNKKNP